MDRRTALLGVIFAAALVIRAVFLCTVNNFYWYGGMAGGARILAKNVAEGRGYVTGKKQDRWFNESFDFNDVTDSVKRLPMVEDIPTFDDDIYTAQSLRPPGYALLIALSYRMFGTGWGLSVVQIVADSAVTILVFLIAGRLGSRRAAYLAAAVYALWPPFARNSMHATPESLVPLLLAGFVLLSLRMLESGRARHAVFAGLAMGALTYLRSEFMLFGFFFVCVVTILDRGRIRQGLLVALVAFASTTPWLARNYLVTGSALTPCAGTAMWYSMGEYPNPWGARPPDDGLLGDEIKKMGLQGDPAAINNFYMKRVTSGIAAHPVFFLSEIARRIPRVLFPKTDWGFVEIHVKNPGFHTPNAQGKPMTILEFFRLNPLVFLIKTVPWVADSVLVVLAMLGAYLTLRKRTKGVQKEALLALAQPAFALAFYSVVYYEPRYMVPAMFAYCTFAGIAVDGLIRRWQDGR